MLYKFKSYLNITNICGETYVLMFFFFFFFLRARAKNIKIPSPFPLNLAKRHSLQEYLYPILKLGITILRLVFILDKNGTINNSSNKKSSDWYLLNAFCMPGTGLSIIPFNPNDKSIRQMLFSHVPEKKLRCCVPWAWGTCSEVTVTQSCPALCDPLDCSPPGSSVYGILQARIQEWVVISFSEGHVTLG